MRCWMGGEVADLENEHDTVGVQTTLERDGDEHRAGEAEVVGVWVRWIDGGLVERVSSNRINLMTELTSRVCDPRQ